jgi:hypothetical protein
MKLFFLKNATSNQLKVLLFKPLYTSYMACVFRFDIAWLTVNLYRKSAKNKEK